MSVLNITTEFVGQVGVTPRLVRIACSDSYDEITTENWLQPLIGGGYSFYPTDVFLIKYAPANTQVGIFTIDISGSDTTLVPFNGVTPLVASDALLPKVSSVEAPVTSGNFAIFQDTNGTIGDEGYLPTKLSATKVVMVDGGTISLNYLPVFSDSIGTIQGYTGGNAVYPGNIQAGLSSSAGYLASFPSSANGGSLRISATASPGNFTSTIQNGAVGQDTTFFFQDPRTASAYALTSTVVPQPGANLISFNVTVTAAALAAGASVILNTSWTAGSQYQIKALQLNGFGTNFSGGGGDRLLSITDNTTVYSLVPAADLQTLANTVWGSTALPFPASDAINTPTAIGANLVAKYSGGTTDYSGGSVVISGLIERIV